MPSEIRLSKVLAQITDELFEADEHAKKRGRAAMMFEECELEFAVRIEDGGKAGVDVWVLTLGADMKRTDANTVRVKFRGIPNAPVQAIQVGEAKDGPKPLRTRSDQTD